MAFLLPLEDHCWVLLRGEGRRHGIIATNEQKRKEIRLAYSIVTDKRNSDKYAFTAITNNKTMERFGYNEMVEILEAMYNELYGGSEDD